MTQKNTDAGWLDSGTPPSLFTLNGKLHAMISNYLVSEIQENISNTNFTSTYILDPFPPLPCPTPLIPTVITTDANYSGKYFVRRGTHQNPRSD